MIMLVIAGLAAAIEPFRQGPSGCAARDVSVSVLADGAQPVFTRPDLDRFYADRARRLGREGQATFQCVLEAQSVRSCDLASVSDPEGDFADASRRIMRFLTFPSLLDRTSTRITFTFRFLASEHPQPCPIAMP